MYYEYAFEIPVSTSPTSPACSEIRVVKGVLETCSVEFPWGCAGLVGVKVYHGEQQVIPTNPDGWLRSDNFVVRSEPKFPLAEEPYSLVIYGYNLDTWYDHTVILRAEVFQEEEEGGVGGAGMVYPGKEIPVSAWLVSEG